MVSSIITPFRWYEKYYQQNRYDIECTSVCDFKLITDRRHLLPFQIKRSPSPNLPSLWILRPCCNDPERQLLNGTAQGFNGSDWDNSAGAWSNISCGGIQANTNNGWVSTNICYNGLTPGKTYTVYFDIVNYLSQQNCGGKGKLTLTITNNGNILHTYQDSGPQSFTFVATLGSNFCFSFDQYCPDDILILDNVQFVEAFDLESTDIQLDTQYLCTKNFGSFDIISYCGSDLGANLTPGCYYSIIKDEGGNFYYSEVITVENFLPDKSPYICLEWYNTCDLKDVVYSEICDCAFKNRLYLPDAVLTRPSYPFKEEGEEDGNHNFNPTFQKWEKIVSLIGYKLPEFIVDALTGIRLHDTIKYYYPLRKKQIVIDAAVEIKSVEYDVEYVVDDCFANVELKMLLNDQYVDETCCIELTTSCKTCGITVPGLGIQDAEQYEYSLMENVGSGSLEIWQYINNTWTLVGSYVAGVWTSDTIDEGTIICDDEKGELSSVGAWQVQGSEIVFCPTITSAVHTTGTKFLFIGDLFLGVFGQISCSFDGGSTWTNILPKFTQAQFAAGIELDINSSPCCTYLTRVTMFDLNGCEYGVSANKTTPGVTNDCC
jgi:hypothetical protein